MSMGNGIMLFTRKNHHKQGQLPQDEAHSSSRSTLKLSPSVTSSLKITLDKSKVPLLRGISKKEDCHSLLEEIEEPNIDLFCLFQKRSKTLSMLVKQTVKQKSPDVDSSKRESNRFSGISDFSGRERTLRQHSTSPTPINSNMSQMSSGVMKRSKRTFRCQPDINKRLSCEVDYLKYINLQACQEQEDKNVKNKEDNALSSKNGEQENGKVLHEEKDLEINKTNGSVRNISCFKKYVKPISLLNLNSELNQIQNGCVVNETYAKEVKNRIESVVLNNINNKNSNFKKHFYKSKLNNCSSPNIQTLSQNCTHPTHTISEPEYKHKHCNFKQTNSYNSPEPCIIVIDYDTEAYENNSTHSKKLNISEFLLNIHCSVLSF